MKIFLYLMLTFHTCLLIGQDIQNSFSGSYDSLSFIKVIGDIEGKTDYQFFFREEWVSDLKISASFTNTPISEVLDTLLQKTTLTHFIKGNRIILANNTKIISNPAIGNYFEQQESDAIVEKGLIFSREYLEGQNDDITNTVFEIGNRKEYAKGKKATIAGYIREIGTDNPVEGAFVYLEEPFIGTSTDSDGFYSLTIPNGKQTLIIQSVNMKNTVRNLILLSNGKLDIEMEVDVIALNSVVVNADREVNVKSPMMGITKIDAEDVKLVPVLLGEKDIIKIATTTSGVQSVGEGSAGVNIRGGKADQNLFLLDGTPVYNTSHFFGFFSVFNSDAIQGMELFKSGIPAEYGGRLSSVFNINTKNLEKQKFSGNGGIGPITSRMMIEGPIYEGGPSFMLGGRGTYSNYIISNIKNSALGNNKASFYDFVAKVNHNFNAKNELSVSGYYSFDSFQLVSDTLLSYTDFSYTNAVLSINWKHDFNNRFRGLLSTGITKYDYNIGYNQLVSQAFNIGFETQEAHISANMDYFVNEKLNYKFGLETKIHSINPGQKRPSGKESLITSAKVDNEKGTEFSPYFSVSFDPVKKISIYGGLRYSIFSVFGPATKYNYKKGESREDYNVVDSIYFKQNEIVKTYHGPEYRFSARYTLNESTSLKASINRTRQNIHLLLNSASIAPTDIWRLSSGHIKPQIADQVSVGIYRNFYGKHTVEMSSEVYYKDIQNLVDFKVGADLQFNNTIERDLLQGNGRSYGIELSIKKSSGWLSGWLNYTLSRSLIQLDGNTANEIINGGKYFSTGYDKPHYLNSITNYKFTRRFSMTLNVVYASGVPVTYPEGKWKFKNTENIFYSNRNEFRIPPYFRTDIGFNVEGSHKIKKFVHSFWTFSIYNVFGINNIYSVFFKVENGKVFGYKLTVFPNPVPTITYNFSF